VVGWAWNQLTSSLAFVAKTLSQYPAVSSTCLR
jgi:hypothetical protein